MIRLTCLKCDSHSFTVEWQDYETDQGVINAECFKCLRCDNTMMNGDQMNDFRKKINDRKKKNESTTAKTSNINT